ncbi:unnamed protein product [Diplocarpon coronariae]
MGGFCLCSYAPSENMDQWMFPPGVRFRLGQCAVLLDTSPLVMRRVERWRISLGAGIVRHGRRLHSGSDDQTLHGETEKVEVEKGGAHPSISQPRTRRSGGEGSLVPTSTSQAVRMCGRDYPTASWNPRDAVTGRSIPERDSDLVVVCEIPRHGSIAVIAITAVNTPPLLVARLLITYPFFSLSLFSPSLFFSPSFFSLLSFSLLFSISFLSLFLFFSRYCHSLSSVGNLFGFPAAPRRGSTGIFIATAPPAPRTLLRTSASAGLACWLGIPRWRPATRGRVELFRSLEDGYSPGERARDDEQQVRRATCHSVSPGDGWPAHPTRRCRGWQYGSQRGIGTWIDPEVEVDIVLAAQTARIRGKPDCPLSPRLIQDAHGPHLRTTLGMPLRLSRVDERRETGSRGENSPRTSLVASRPQFSLQESQLAGNARRPDRAPTHNHPRRPRDRLRCAL